MRSNEAVLAFQPPANLRVWRNDEIPVDACAFAYKMIKSDTPLVRAVLGFNGFREVPPPDAAGAGRGGRPSDPLLLYHPAAPSPQVHPNHRDFSVLWGNRHILPHHYRTLLPHQKANHFPRSSELTRKDRLSVHRARRGDPSGVPPCLLTRASLTRQWRFLL